jgi:hypothetical protein
VKLDSGGAQWRVNDLYIQGIYLANAPLEGFHDRFFSGPLPGKPFGPSVGVSPFSRGPSGMQESRAA